MSELMVFLRSSLGETVALSLLHFIWQGAALALVAVAAWKGLEKSSAQSRYTTGCALLLCMLLAPIVTSVFLTWQVPAGSPAALEYIPPPRVSPGDISAQSSNAMWFPAVLALWFAGVTAFSIRAAGGWALAIYRLSISRKEPPPVVRASALELASRLGIIRIVRIYESSVASVPAVFGWLRPVIILPASVVTGLPASHLNAILADELAHIARHDFLVNCLQSVVEVLLFYHPAVWWLSRKVRQEREICCDATAAEMCGDRILYSRALLSLEEGRQEFALAATGGDLKSRIEHLLQQGARHNRVPELTSFVPALIVFATVLMCAASMIVRAQEKKIETPYEQWAKEDVLYIMQTEERSAWERLRTDEEREHFIAQFWQRRDPAPQTSENEFKEEHYRRIAYANARFGDARAGWATPRGSVYIRYGPPDEIESHPSSYREVWLYRDGRQFEFSGEDYRIKLQKPDPSPASGVRVMERISIEKLPEQQRNYLQPRLTPFVGQPMSNALMDQIRAVVQPFESSVIYTWRIDKSTGNASVELTPLSITAR